MSADIYERVFAHGDLQRLRAQYPRVAASLLVQRFLLPPAVPPASKAVAVAEAAISSVSFAVKSFDDATGEFEGLAAVFSVRDFQNDIIDPGAFDASLLKTRVIPLLWQHQPDQLLGTAEVEDTSEGLRVRGRLNLGVARAREILSLLRQGAIRGLSIGYDAIQSQWRAGVRHLTEIRLHEVSLTPFPAQVLATVSTVKTAGPADTTDEARFAEWLRMVQLALPSSESAAATALARLLQEMRREFDTRIRTQEVD